MVNDESFFRLVVHTLEVNNEALAELHSATLVVLMENYLVHQDMGTTALPSLSSTNAS